MQRRYLVYTVLLILLPIGFVYARNQPYYSGYNNGFSESFGDAFIYNQDHVLNEFTMSGIPMKTILYFHFFHNLKTFETEINFFVAILPIDPLIILEGEGYASQGLDFNESQLYFYGKLNNFKLLVDGDTVIPEQINSGFTLGIGTSDEDSLDNLKTKYYNILRHDFEYIYTSKKYSFHTFNIKLDFNYDILSTNENYSNDGSEVLLGTSPISTFEFTKSTPNLFFSRAIPTIIFLILLSLIIYIIMKEYNISPNIKSSSDLKFFSFIFPHLITPTISLFLITGLRYDLISAMYELSLLLVLFSFIPIGIENLVKNYYYKGINTNPPVRINSSYLNPNLFQTGTDKSKLNENEKYKLYRLEHNLFGTVGIWTLKGMLIIFVAKLIGLSWLYFLVHIIWIYLRKISI